MAVRAPSAEHERIPSAWQWTLARNVYIADDNNRRIGVVNTRDRPDYGG